MAWPQGRKQLEYLVRQALRGGVSFYETSGSINLYQMKPDVETGGTTSITALEVSPRFSDAAAGSQMRGIVSDVILQGTTGDISGRVDCIEAKLESASGSTRTVTGPVSCLRCINDMHGTVTTGPYCISVDTHGGNKAWAGFAYLPDDGGNIADLASATATINTVIKYAVGSTVSYIAGYTSYTAA